MNISALLMKILKCFALIKTALFYRVFFGAIGSRTVLYGAGIYMNAKYISVGKKTIVRHGARLEVVINDGNHGEINIGDNVNIEQNVHIVSGGRIDISSNVSITANCAIVDINHPYDNVNSNLKIGDRLECKYNRVFIGENTFIGIGSIILPNVHIGKNCIVGANSVVNVDVPDFSVVAGVPAKIIKRYNFSNEVWETVK